ncbi:hypothetical protein [Sorangium sp. So ce176]
MSVHILGVNFNRQVCGYPVPEGTLVLWERTRIAGRRPPARQVIV